MPNDDAYSGFAHQPILGNEYSELEFLFSQLAGRMATSQPVLVKAVGAGTVDVQPMVAQIDGDGNATLHGTIHNVPVLMARGGTNGFIVDPVVGDIGLAVMASHDISAVKANRAPSNPGSRRRFDWADATYVPGMLGADLLQFVRVAGGGITMESPMVTATHSLQVNDAATGSFTTMSGQVVTVFKGIVVAIV